MEALDKLLKDTEENVASGLNLDHTQWLDNAFKLNSMVYSLNDELYTLEHELAEKKAEMFSDIDMTAAKAKIFIESDPRYKQVNLLRGKRKQIEENIRLAKKMSDAKKFEYDNPQY